MSKPDLDAIRARVEAATEGPWAAQDYDTAPGDEGSCITAGEPGMGQRAIAYAIAYPWTTPESCAADAEFIAHARQDIPNLLTYIGELETLLDEVRALAGPDNESGMISASAIFHTIGTGNKGGES